MSRTLKQQMADSHERDIAEWIGGVQHKGSGNQWHRPMDASNDERIPYALAADGKSTLGKSIPITLDMWRKAVDQTFGKIPTLWLRWYTDESLRTVEEDGVFLRSRDLVEILEAARNWESMQQRLKDFVLKGEDYGICPVDPPASEKSSDGCDCCR